MIDGNLIAGNGIDGVTIVSHAAANRVTKNRIMGNHGDGLSIGSTSGGTLVAGNSAVGNAGTGFAIDNPETTVTKNVANANFNGIVVATTAVDGGHNTARTNTILGAPCSPAIACASPFTSKAGSTAPSCAMHVTTSITLDADGPPCAGDGLTVDADGVTIDLNGHALQGTRSSGQVGIDVQNHAHVTIRNGVVRDFDVGIRSTGEKLKLDNVEARNNLGTGALVSGDGLVVTKSAFVLNSVRGLSIASGLKPTVRGSFFVANDDAGLVADTTAGSFTGLTAALNGTGIVLANAGAARLKSGTVVGNSVIGIWMMGQATSSLTVVRNLVAGNLQTGIVANTPGVRLTLDGNTVGGNTFNGIIITSSTEPFAVTKNLLVGNGFRGAEIDFANGGGSVASNVAVGNGTDGIATDAVVATFSKNVADANHGFGILPLHAGATDGGGNEAQANLGGQCGAPIVCK